MLDMRRENIFLWFSIILTLRFKCIVIDCKQAILFAINTYITSLLLRTPCRYAEYILACLTLNGLFIALHCIALDCIHLTRMYLRRNTCVQYTLFYKQYYAQSKKFLPRNQNTDIKLKTNFFFVLRYCLEPGCAVPPLVEALRYKP